MGLAQNRQCAIDMSVVHLYILNNYTQSLTLGLEETHSSNGGAFKHILTEMKVLNGLKNLLRASGIKPFHKLQGPVVQN